MAEVLGSLSFLDTPDVNGVLVLTATTGINAVSGVANQTSVTGSLPSLTVGLADNLIAPGTASLTLPIGTTAQRPGSPAAGMTRFNSTLSALEYYNGTAWLATGKVLQTVVGTISSTSSNLQIPFDNTTPLSTEGVQLWSQSFTPISADSTIVITVSSFFTVNSASNVFTSGAIFSGTTNIGSQMLGFTTDTGDGNNYCMVVTAPSGSTTTRTYSFRAGPNSAVTVFYCQGVTGQAFGSTTNSGTYVIQEILL